MGVICDLIKQRLEIKMIAIDTSSCKTAELIFPFLFCDQANLFHCSICLSLQICTLLPLVIGQFVL